MIEITLSFVQNMVIIFAEMHLHVNHMTVWFKLGHKLLLQHQTLYTTMPQRNPSQLLSSFFSAVPLSDVSSVHEDEYSDFTSI